MPQRRQRPPTPTRTVTIWHALPMVTKGLKALSSQARGRGLRWSQAVARIDLSLLAQTQLPEHATSRTQDYGPRSPLASVKTVLEQHRMVVYPARQHHLSAS